MSTTPYRWLVGITRRGVYGTPDGGTRHDPLRHVFTARPASRTGWNVRALCGTSITPNPMPGPDGIGQAHFDPEHPRACRRCVRALREREARS